MQSVLKIPIVFEDTKTRMITLQDPKTSITQANVQTFAEYAITNELFSYGGYRAINVEDAYIYNTNEIPLS